VKLVLLESPFAGDIELNVAYARAALRDTVMRGESALASHLLWTQPGVLRDEVPAERELGIAAGLAWGAVATASVFYVDLGWSRGMRAALVDAGRCGRQIEVRRIGEAWRKTVCELTQLARAEWDNSSGRLRQFI